MSQTHTNLNYHIVFGTKDRRPTLLPEFRDDLCRYLGGIVKNSNGHPWKLMRSRTMCTCSSGCRQRPLWQTLSAPLRPALRNG